MAKTNRKGYKGKKYVRPVQVRYYASESDMPDNFCAWGGCGTRRGVVRGAMAHILDGYYVMARVYEDGICTMTIKLDDHGMPAAYFGGRKIPPLF
jgi:hypothetical protein